MQFTIKHTQKENKQIKTYTNKNRNKDHRTMAMERKLSKSEAI